MNRSRSQTQKNASEGAAQRGLVKKKVSSIISKGIAQDLRFLHSDKEYSTNTVGRQAPRTPSSVSGLDELLVSEFWSFSAQRYDAKISLAQNMARSAQVDFGRVHLSPVTSYESLSWSSHPFEYSDERKVHGLTQKELAGFGLSADEHSRNVVLFSLAGQRLARDESFVYCKDHPLVGVLADAYVQSCDQRLLGMVFGCESRFQLKALQVLSERFERYMAAPTHRVHLEALLGGAEHKSLWSGIVKQMRRRRRLDQVLSRKSDQWSALCQDPVLSTEEFEHLCEEYEGIVSLGQRAAECGLDYADRLVSLGHIRDQKNAQYSEHVAFEASELQALEQRAQRVVSRADECGGLALSDQAEAYVGCRSLLSLPSGSSIRELSGQREQVLLVYGAARERLDQWQQALSERVSADAQQMMGVLEVELSRVDEHRLLLEALVKEYAVLERVLQHIEGDPSALRDLGQVLEQHRLSCQAISQYERISLMFKDALGVLESGQRTDLPSQPALVPDPPLVKCSRSLQVAVLDAYHECQSVRDSLSESLASECDAPWPAWSGIPSVDADRCQSLLARALLVRDVSRVIGTDRSESNVEKVQEHCSLVEKAVRLDALVKGLSGVLDRRFGRRVRREVRESGSFSYSSYVVGCCSQNKEYITELFDERLRSLYAPLWAVAHDLIGALESVSGSVLSSFRQQLESLSAQRSFLALSVQQAESVSGLRKIPYFFSHQRQVTKSQKSLLEELDARIGRVRSSYESLTAVHEQSWL